MHNVLGGLRVVEGSAFVAAPSGGMTLAQLGADVIRFDPIGGGIDHRRWPITPDGASLYWAGLNKGKRSLQVDLRSAAGRELLAELICAPGPGAGIFLTNFPAEGWMGYEALRARRDDLIMVAISGNHDGTTAVDYTVNCAVGYPMVTGHDSGGLGDGEGGREEDRPVNHVLPAWDVICGQTAAVGLLAAERHRRLTGEGQLVTLALSDVALAAVAALGHVAEAQVLDSERARIGNDLYGALGRDFRCADGRRVIAVAISPKQWRSLCAACEMAEEMARLEAETGLDLARSEGDRFLARHRIFAVIEEWCAPRTFAEVTETFDRHGVCWGPYQTFRQLVAEDPRCSVANPLFGTVTHPGVGTVLEARSPLRFGGLTLDDPTPAPQLGQHTEEVLAECLGLSRTEIGRLHDDGVVAGPHR
ncbi:MAG: CoA transferase [bacterium]|nr:CoA transferase [bacterium]MXZ29424.1 2-methylfumaryl-CoA isomerase [Acidimicrobiia bacterium]MYB24131.1 2-methylfumaryl-CoA isomerase [Acidimicrobiia bacterium]MYE67549.1 2-methylfumaryl-CoA isomerase [Acidimicrobiia bacterium]MYJ14068.1 2-methylfumaryl-CoA isomerase [Acidimicrobiia bacterium]